MVWVLEKSKKINHFPLRGFECYFLPDFKPAGILRVQPAFATLVNPEKKMNITILLGVCVLNTLHDLHCEPVLRQDPGCARCFF